MTLTAPETATRRRPGLPSHDGHARLVAEQDRRAGGLAVLVATVAVVMIGFERPLASGVTTALPPVLLLLPVWVRRLRDFRGAGPLMLLVVLSLASGLVLAAGSQSRTISERGAWETGFHLVATFGSVGVFLWARTVMRVEQIALVYGLATLVAGILKLPGSENPWKYELATPITLIVLALAARVTSRTRARAATFGALAAIGCVSIINDYRSNFGMCMVAVLVVLWQSRKPEKPERLGHAGTMLLLTGIVVAFYFAVTRLLVAGVFGDDIAEKSELQIQQSGNLLVGGRPEWTATLALMEIEPGGFGLGAEPTSSDLQMAKAALYGVGIPLDNGYVDNYMFGGHFKLHSITADLWAQTGVLGLVLAATIVLLLVLSLTSRMVDRRPSALASFLVLLALWDVGFGPILSDLPEVAFALGIVLLPKREGVG